MNQKFRSSLIVASILGIFITPNALQAATSLSLGADYYIRGVSVEERDKNVKNLDYYTQKIQAYLVTDLSKDVEATVRIQSVTPWGMEQSTGAFNTRYPDGKGTPWIQNAFIRMPNLWRDNVILTIGRQPIVWGDGEILSDDDLGFNALRLQLLTPFEDIGWLRWLAIDLDGFTAKINEGLHANEDRDLHGALLGFDRNLVRWEIMGLWENDRTDQPYQVGSSSVSITANDIKRTIYGIRAKANLRDAFLKGAYYVQGGEVTASDPLNSIDLGGSAWTLALGGKQDTGKIGRFGAILEIMEGEGDSTGTSGDDEAFRPSFASRWDGLERKGMGNYFAGGWSDARSTADPFAPVTSVNDGLPDNTSGIQSIHFGIELTPWAAWTFSLDYYQYKALNNLSGSKELGTEFNYTLLYRYSGLVAIKATTGTFDPGEAYDDASSQKASWSSAEAEIRF